jgi:hypothetical protein
MICIRVSLFPFLSRLLGRFQGYIPIFLRPVQITPVALLTGSRNGTEMLAKVIVLFLANVFSTNVAHDIFTFWTLCGGILED